MEDRATLNFVVASDLLLHVQHLRERDGADGAIICVAVVVEANASESVSVTAELGPMLRDSWRTTFKSFFETTSPTACGGSSRSKGENPDDSDEAEHEEGPEKVIKYGDSKELERVWERIVGETGPPTATEKRRSAFLLSNNVRRRVVRDVVSL